MSARDNIPGHSTRPLMLIDTAALARNYRALQKLADGAKVGASVKADAYGLGLERTAKVLYGAGCRMFWVATPGEGMLLRKAIGSSSSIYVLNGPAPQDIGLFFKGMLKPVLNSPYQIGLWAEHVTEHAPFSAVMIDTGMNRLGLSAPETQRLASSRKLMGKVRPDHVLSHLACADTPDHPLNVSQRDRFAKLAKLFPDTTKSLANSAGIYLGGSYHFDAVRPGIALYGGTATDDPKREVTEPVVTIAATVLQVRDVPEGRSIGYDASYVAPRDMRVATVGAGYNDGLPLALSGTNAKPGGRSTVKSEPVNIVGRVSMDLTMLDVTDLDDVTVGDTARFFGRHLHATARRAGTIDYELLVRCGSRLRRTYHSGSPSRKPPGKPPAGRAPSAAPEGSRKSRDRSSPRSGGSAPRSQKARPVRR